MAGVLAIFAYIINGSVDNVGRPCGASGVHPLAAGDTDDFDLLTRQNGHEHSTHCASGSPHYGFPSLERPEAREPTAVRPAGRGKGNSAK
jgi:hypothetical protein